MGQKLALREVEESQGFTEVKHLKYQNGFFPIYSLSKEIYLIPDPHVILS